MYKIVVKKIWIVLVQRGKIRTSYSSSTRRRILFANRARRTNLSQSCVCYCFRCIERIPSKNEETLQRIRRKDYTVVLCFLGAGLHSWRAGVVRLFSVFPPRFCRPHTRIFVVFSRFVVIPLTRSVKESRSKLPQYFQKIAIFSKILT